jgi:hypothetical protein
MHGRERSRLAVVRNEQGMRLSLLLIFSASVALQFGHVRAVCGGSDQLPQFAKVEFSADR